MTRQRIIAIGDIHGCAHALDTVIEAIRPTRDDLIIVLGDFIDQGFESRLVVESLIALRERCEFVSLLGNHEEMLLAARSSEPALRYWENCGGARTLSSYRFGGSLEDIPFEHWDFIAECRDWYETDEHLFTHANFDPELPLAKLPDHTLRWELLDPEVVRCHNSGKTAVVGHTEQSDGEVLDLGCVKCIDTACWRYGWLTALDVVSGRTWQASRFGQLREPDEAPVGPTGPLRSVA
ncbi:MAG: serine/threonine protein phosphatase [Planctomycetales bacterium]|nr:serine/threonine protein phosphatase [Planctomycetales bacterium]